MTALSEKLLTGGDLEDVLVLFCCYSYDASISEAVEKIYTGERDYLKCFLCIILCCIATACHR